MATLRLGDGDPWDGNIDVKGSPFDHPHVPESVTLIYSTPKGDDQKNFPIAIELNRDESLKLISRICEEMTTQPDRGPIKLSPPPFDSGVLL